MFPIPRQKHIFKINSCPPHAMTTLKGPLYFGAIFAFLIMAGDEVVGILLLEQI